MFVVILFLEKQLYELKSIQIFFLKTQSLEHYSVW